MYYLIPIQTVWSSIYHQNYVPYGPVAVFLLLFYKLLCYVSFGELIFCLCLKSVTCIIMYVYNILFCLQRLIFYPVSKADLLLIKKRNKLNRRSSPLFKKYKIKLKKSTRAREDRSGLMGKRWIKKKKKKKQVTTHESVG